MSSRDKMFIFMHAEILIKGLTVSQNNKFPPGDFDAAAARHYFSAHVAIVDSCQITIVISFNCSSFCRLRGRL